MPLPFFTTEKLLFLEDYQPRYLDCKKNRIISSVFMPEVITAYKARWPEDDVDSADFERTRTKSGRWSKKRPEGAPKPLREVSPLFSRRVYT